MDSSTGFKFVAAATLISGFSIFANKFGVAGINSSIYVLSRGILVAAMLAAIILMAGNWKKVSSLSRRDWGALALVGLVGGSVPFLLFFRGLQMASAAEAGFLQKTMFAFVAIISVLFLRQKLDAKVLIPAALLLVGSALLVGFTGALSFGFGSLLILTATLLWAVENVVSKRLLATIDPLVLAAGRMGIGAVFVAAFLSFTGEISLMGSITMPQLQWIAVSSVILLAYVATWYSGLARVDATVATSMLLLASPITTLLNYFYGGIQLTPAFIAGTMLLVAGAGLMVYLVPASPSTSTA